MTADTPDIAPPAPPVADDRGLECPRCGCHHFHVVYVQRLRSKIRRRRECRHCGRRITTTETAGAA